MMCDTEKVILPFSHHSALWGKHEQSCPTESCIQCVAALTLQTVPFVMYMLVSGYEFITQCLLL